MNLNLDIVPTNLPGAVDLIINALTQEEKEHFLDPAGLHHGFGRWLRNNWSLWERETILVQWFVKKLGIVHADDISSIILENVRANLLQQEFDPEKHVEVYKTHWIGMGLDPKTMEKL